MNRQILISLNLILNFKYKLALGKPHEPEKHKKPGQTESNSASTTPNGTPKQEETLRHTPNQTPTSNHTRLNSKAKISKPKHRKNREKWKEDHGRETTDHHTQQPGGNQKTKAPHDEGNQKLCPMTPDQLIHGHKVHTTKIQQKTRQTSSNTIH